MTLGPHLIRLDNHTYSVRALAYRLAVGHATVPHTGRPFTPEERQLVQQGRRYFDDLDGMIREQKQYAHAVGHKFGQDSDAWSVDSGYVDSDDSAHHSLDQQYLDEVDEIYKGFVFEARSPNVSEEDQDHYWMNHRFEIAWRLQRREFRRERFKKQGKPVLF